MKTNQNLNKHRPCWSWHGHIRQLATLVFVALGGLFTACSETSTKAGLPPKILATKPNALSLQYYGYWRDSDIENYMSEIQTHSNYTMINWRDNGAGVQQAASYNLSVFCPGAGDERPPTDELLRAVKVYWISDDAENAANNWCVHHACAYPPDTLGCWSCFKAQLESDAAALRQQAHALGNDDVRFALNFVGDFRHYGSGFSLPNGMSEFGYECYGGDHRPLADEQETLQFCQDMVNSTPLRAGDRV